jgi:hypothetical protein
MFGQSESMNRSALMAYFLLVLDCFLTLDVLRVRIKFEVLQSVKKCKEGESDLNTVVLVYTKFDYLSTPLVLNVSNLFCSIQFLESAKQFLYV